MSTDRIVEGTWQRVWVSDADAYHEYVLQHETVRCVVYQTLKGGGWVVDMSADGWVCEWIDEPLPASLEAAMDFAEQLARAYQSGFDAAKDAPLIGDNDTVIFAEGSQRLSSGLKTDEPPAS